MRVLKASVTAGAAAKSMSATHKGSTSASKRFHFNESVRRRSKSVSNLIAMVSLVWIWDKAEKLYASDWQLSRRGKTGKMSFTRIQAQSICPQNPEHLLPLRS